MISSELKSKDESLREILSNDKKYRTPKFQRDYSWEVDHWKNLWEDIKSLISGEEKYHFMGILVIQLPQEKSDTDASIILDGQQRLTTFSLLVLSAIKRLKEIGNEEVRIDELLKKFIGSKDLKYLRTENKLILNKNNDSFYKEAVQGNEIPKTEKKLTIKLIHDAIEFFHKKFKDFDTGKEIGGIIEELSNKLFFITIYIGNELNAYKVFETLNNRTVQLSLDDLLKNYIFSIIDADNKVPDEVLDELENKWEQIGSNIGENQYTNYILTEWNRKNKMIRKSELFKNIKNTITNRESAKRFLDELEINSNRYTAVSEYLS